MNSLVREKSRALRDVEDAVAASRLVSIRGSGSHSSRLPAADVRAATVSVDSGIIRVDPGEMVVECLAGTPVAELQEALADVGQRVNLPSGGTVGGTLATSRNSIHRLGRGALRDAVLRLDVVGSDGRAYRCGGDTVKNVSGFDLCRLHVGAFGTLGVIVTVLLRTFPLPRSSRWMTTSHSTGATIVSAQWGVTSVLSNGRDAYVHCEGHPRDIDEVMKKWKMNEVDGAPSLGTFRRSVSPQKIEKWLSTSVFGELGVGIVHEHSVPPMPSIDPAVRMLNNRVRDQFDPDRVLNQHIDVLEVLR